MAPEPNAFPVLTDKTGALLRRPYDWSDEVRELAAQTLLVYGDADSIPVTHAAEFFALLGGGLRDGGWEGSGRSDAPLAILDGRTHYDIFESDQIASVFRAFLR